jgi:hypothetical protein
MLGKKPQALMARKTSPLEKGSTYMKNFFAKVITGITKGYAKSQSLKRMEKCEF